MSSWTLTIALVGTFPALGFTQIIHEATHLSNLYCLDNVYSNNSQWITKTMVYSIGLLDHLPLNWYNDTIDDPDDICYWLLESYVS